MGGFWRKMFNDSKQKGTLEIDKRLRALEETCKNDDYEKITRKVYVL